MTDPARLLAAALPDAHATVSLPLTGTTLPSLEELRALLPAFEILALHGQGGMGAVYRARHRSLDRPVALKVLRPGRPGAAERFAAEAKALARLHHPHIVSVFDHGVAGDLCWMAMEFVEGPNLRQVLQEGRLPAPTILGFIPSLCAALQYAHDQGVVHRDLKPENLLVAPDGTIKIADFGLARLLDADQRLTQADAIMGTPHYMAPEQIERPLEVDHRADLFALGVVLYEMLTGELPLGRFQPPSQRVQVDVRLDGVVLRALEKQPERRYQQAADLGRDVAQATSPRRHGAWAWAASVLVLVGMIAGTAVLFISPAHAADASDAGIIVTARTLAEDVRAGRYDQARVRFDSTMRSALSVKMLKDVWEDRLITAGPATAIQAPVASQEGQYRVVRVPVTCAKRTETWKVVFNADGTIGGLWLPPAEAQPQDVLKTQLTAFTQDFWTVADPVTLEPRIHRAALPTLSGANLAAVRTMAFDHIGRNVTVTPISYTQDDLGLTEVADIIGDHGVDRMTTTIDGDGRIIYILLKPRE